PQMRRRKRIRGPCSTQSARHRDPASSRAAKLRDRRDISCERGRPRTTSRRRMRPFQPRELREASASSPYLSLHARSASGRKSAYPTTSRCPRKYHKFRWRVAIQSGPLRLVLGVTGAAAFLRAVRFRGGHMLKRIAPILLLIAFAIISTARTSLAQAKAPAEI